MAGGWGWGSVTIDDLARASDLKTTPLTEKQPPPPSDRKNTPNRRPCQDVEYNKINLMMLMASRPSIICINVFVFHQNFFYNPSKFVYCKGACPDEARFLNLASVGRKNLKNTIFSRCGHKNS